MYLRVKTFKKSSPLTYTGNVSTSPYNPALVTCGLLTVM